MKSRKGFFGKVMKSLSRDTTEVEKANDLTRNDIPYKIYTGAIIRHIIIQDLPFGTPLIDTVNKVVSPLTRLANRLHHTTRESVIQRNLFFKTNDTIVPFLMADNEAFLRKLPYVQDASIKILPIDSLRSDSVDVQVYVKDLFSLGGAVSSIGIKNTDITVREDNIYGSGDGFILHGLYDMSRNKNFGAGAEYVQRNISGTFIDFNAGYLSYFPSISGLKEENQYYIRVSKQLVNRFKHWTYELDASYHSTRNMYANDSIYYLNSHYKYFNFDVWAGYNINSTGFSARAEDKKLRKLVALRLLNQQFQALPEKYINNYYWQYPNISGGIASISFYRQNFYKSQYIYAFGINEDIPEGLILSLNAGYIKKQTISRPYIGINYQRSAFNKKNNYLSYTLSGEAYLNHNKAEDINLFAAVDYFDHLKALGTKWKQRTFVNISFAKQINTILNEPLYIDSKFALPSFRNGNVGGSLRASVRVESVFFSPWNIASFRFAPFAFANTGLFTPYNTPVNTSNIYTIVGGGLRMRNESLVFGTLEFRGYYFLKKNVHNSNWKLDISSNISFKYNNNLVRRPDFIEVN